VILVYVYNFLEQRSFWHENLHSLFKNENGCWRIKVEGIEKNIPLHGIDYGLSLENYPYDLEVIGNIYENPELITN